MDRSVAVFLVALVGRQIAIQAPVNAELGRVTGGIAAAVINFAVGGLLLAAILIFSGKAHWKAQWQFTG